VIKKEKGAEYQASGEAYLPEFFGACTSGEWYWGLSDVFRNPARYQGAFCNNFFAIYGNIHTILSYISAFFIPKKEGRWFRNDLNPKKYRG
jgi:hypothetical protein